jgi:hypothetical protein
MNAETKKKLNDKLGDWMFDVAKYIFTIMLISPLFTGMPKNWITFSIIGGAVVAGIALGIYFISKNK